jgi:hypothetical protein
MREASGYIELVVFVVGVVVVVVDVDEVLVDVEVVVVLDELFLKNPPLPTLVRRRSN